MKYILLTTLSLFLSLCSVAGTITGAVTDAAGAALPFASVTVKGSTRGVVANGQGRYSLSLPDGRYTLVCQYVGYKTAEQPVTVGAEAVTINFTLAVQDLKMQEVVIKRGDDPALEIMRQTIAKREFYNKQTDSFSVEVYIKSLVRSKEVPKKVLGTPVDRSDFGREGLDSAGRGILFLSESVTKVSYQRPDKFKYEVLSSRQSGGGYGFSFPTFINFYTNNVALFNGSVNPRGFVSPVADGAFRFYRFRFEGSFFEDGKMIDRIRVTPRRKNEPLFDGYVQIVDGEWRIHSLSLTTIKAQGLELLDTVTITQLHNPVAPDVYKTTNQVVYFSAGFLGFGFTGNFLNVYSNYDFNPGFGNRHFNRVLLRYDTAFNKKDSSYWTATRPVPLEVDERRNFRFKDSVRQEELTGADTSSKAYKDSTGQLRRGQSLGAFLTRGSTKTFYGSRQRVTLQLTAPIRTIQYNTVEGLSLGVTPVVTFRPWRRKHEYRLRLPVRYGLANNHFLGWSEFTIRPRREDYRNRYLELSGGKRWLQFNRENPVSAFTNSFSTLFYRNNWLKIYETWFAKAVYNSRLENGLRFTISANYEDRIPVRNYTDYTFFRKGEKNLLPNHPYELAAIPFNGHSAFVTELTLAYQPGQYYIEFPNRKVPVGSKYPTLELQYSKGIPNLFASTADFDKWKFSVYDDANLKLFGLLKYRVAVGGFLNRRQVDIPDFTHFTGNQTLFNFHYVNSFQLAPYYRYSNTERLYGLLHAEHHFNGLLTNKIPLFNKLKWNLVAGANTFYVNSDNYYVEGFAGVENIFKFLRIDFITATQAAGGTSTGVRFGLGGLLGGAIRLETRD